MAIASGDAKRISAIKGVGRKTAEKICVELRDKVDLFAAGALSAGKAENSVIRDAVAALRALGFNEETSSKMVADALAADPSLDNVEAVIKTTLKSR
jgi:Holliday junction DNA helicase RuvA